MLLRKCPRCGRYTNALARRPLRKNDDGTYRFEIQHANACPYCGSLYMQTQNKYRAIFDFIHLSPRLNLVQSMFLDGYFDAAIREASIVLEDLIKEYAGIDGYGTNLIDRAFEGDESNPPLIALNELHTSSEKNEQEGVKMMIKGFVKSIRNITIHNSIGHGSFQAFEILCFVDFIIKLIEGDSYTKKAHWIKVTDNERSFIVPNRFDRIKLKSFENLKSLTNKIYTLLP